MYGAIIGDIVGSLYEFDDGRWLDPEEFFQSWSSITDDSVMTIAVANALIKAGKNIKENKIKKNLISSMKKYWKLYQNVGYGEKFEQWLQSKESEPYNSCGNGSAMRVSSVGWLYNSIETTRAVAKMTAEVSHNHPEGIKGAEAVACVIYLARIGRSKKEIAEYVTREFDYNINRTGDSIRQNYIGNSTCQGTVPEAIIAFMEGRNFVEVIQNAISFGGDADTLTAIAGSMAEAYYGVPHWIKVECRKRLDDKMLKMIDAFQTIITNI